MGIWACARPCPSYVARSLRLAHACSSRFFHLFLLFCTAIHERPTRSTAVCGSLVVDHGVRVAVGARGVPLVRPVRDAGVVPRAPDDAAAERLDLAEYRAAELCAAAAHAEIGECWGALGIGESLMFRGTFSFRCLALSWSSLIRCRRINTRRDTLCPTPTTFLVCLTPTLA